MRSRKNEVRDDDIVLACNHICRINSENLQKSWEEVERESERKRFFNDRMRYYVRDNKVPPEQATLIVQNEW